MESHDYNGMGNVIINDGSQGQVTSYTYDALDRLKTITHADGSVITLWDAGDRMRQVIDSANDTITLDYDDLDRLIRETSPQGQLDYDYADAGRRTQLTVAGHDPIIYGYDDADRLIRIERGSVAIDFTYDAADRRATVIWPNGIVGTYAFDDADQLLSVVYERGTTRVGEVGYAYDLAGRRIEQSGSLAKLMMPATMNAATYDAANRLTNWGGQSLSYDDNGNLISHGAASYGWNVRNELISTSAGAGSFAYDALGRRTSRTVAGSTVSYLHDGVDLQNFKPLSEKDAMKMTKEQAKVCANLAEEAKQLIRKRQAQVFKYGRILSAILAMPVTVDSVTNSCKADPMWCLDQIQGGDIP